MKFERGGASDLSVCVDSAVVVDSLVDSAVVVYSAVGGYDVVEEGVVEVVVA